MKDLLKTLFIGKQWIHLPSVDSTNAYALNWSSKNNPIEGTVISADQQDRGRGQYGRSWYSTPGESMILTVILRPFFLAPLQQFALSQCISIALYDFISDLVPGPVYVKWPNDLYIRDKKVGGILIQNSLQGKVIQHSLVGIGININQSEFPKNLPGAISLNQVSGRRFEVMTLMKKALVHLEQRYVQLRNGEKGRLAEEYHSVLYGINKELTFRKESGEKFRAKILGVDQTGNLRLAVGDHIESYSLQEVRMQMTG